MRIGVDVGGTNTDAVLIDGLRIVATNKQPTTADVSSGVSAAIRAVLEEGNVAPGAITAVMIGTTHFTNALVEAMITLSHALDMSVTAEGVESVEQRDILVALGCNTLQGYLLSAPISAERIERMFEGATEFTRSVA